MKKKSVVCLSLLVGTLSWCTAFATTYDLAACVDHGLRHNPAIASRKIAVEESKKELGKAVALFLPTVSVSHQNSTLSNNGSLSESTNYPDQSNSSTNFRLSQPLFTGFAGIITFDKVKYVEEYRKAELREARLGLIREIQRQYFEYLRLLDGEETANDTIAGYEKQLMAANAFYQQRLAPKLQVLQSEVRLSTARQSLVQVQTLVANARLKLNELLALPAAASAVEYSGRLVDFDYQTIKPLAEYTSRKASRPNLQMANINIDLARKESKMILSRYLPKVSVDVDYSDRQLDYDYSGYKSYAEDYWTLGLNMSMNLFQGGADAAAYSQQLLAVTRYQENLRQLSNQIDRELLEAYSSQQEALTRIDSAMKIKEVALAALDRARTAFELGLGTTITVLDAQQEVTQAMVGLARARADFLFAQADLEYLTAHDEEFVSVDNAEASLIQ